MKVRNNQKNCEEKTLLTPTLQLPGQVLLVGPIYLEYIGGNLR